MIQNLLITSYKVFILIYLLFLAITNTIIVSNITVIFSASNQLLNSLNIILEAFPTLYENSLHINNFREFIDNTLNSNKCILDHQSNTEKFETIIFENIDYRYNNNGRNIINNLSLSINYGEKIALVGPNGSGKSTIIKLILNLYSPTKGKILVNSKNINFLSNSLLYSNIGVVFQDSKFFSLPLIENILMRSINKGDPKKDESKVLEALEKVGMKDKVLALPNGIYTYITNEFDNDGVVFSQGELQKLAIARVLANEYDFLILDEPTSSLDAKSENLMFELLFEKYKKKSLIIISHRLLNIVNVDKIFFLEDGHITEKGTHKELLNLNGKYSTLYRVQSKNNIKEVSFGED